MNSSSSSSPSSIHSQLTSFKFLEIIQKDPTIPVFHIYLNNPSHHNALTPPFFTELPLALSLLSTLSITPTLILSSRGPHFSSGIHLSTLSSTPSSPSLLRSQILSLQSSLSSLESYPKPILASIHNLCLGAALDLISACDIRYCTTSATFSVTEVDMALAADLGTLQRLPTIIGFGNAMEMALTGRRVGGVEAKGMGLVSRVFESREEMEEGVERIARELAEKSGNAVVGTKRVMVNCRDLTVGEGLEYVATWSAAMLRSGGDLEEAVKAKMEKRKPVFSKM